MSPRAESAVRGASGAERLRVAMVILEYLPVNGGAQRQLAALAPLLGERGVEVSVLTRGGPGLARRERIDGVAVERLSRPGGGRAALTFTAAAMARLAALRPHVVHAYSLFSPGVVAGLAKRALGVATVAKVLRGGREGEVERLRRKRFAGARLRQVRASIDAFVSISDEIDAELAGIGVEAERRHRIPNGVDIGRFAPASAARREALRRALALPEGPTAVYCGRLVPEKNVGVLLEAWERLRARRPDAQLCIVGDGPEGAALRSRAGDAVHFAGDRPDVLPFLQTADAFVLPSATEGLSNALLEAMAVGLPVAATRVGAAPELIEDGVHGRLVVPGDAPALAAALEALLFGPSREALGVRARERVSAHHALPRVADRLVALYERLAVGAARRSPRDRHPTHSCANFEHPNRHQQEVDPT